MDPILAEWGGLLLRWTHVITGIAWIGSSFYFMHLDAALKPVEGITPGMGGGAWEVHGGGFYEVRKYMQAPPGLPEDLIWHKWQAYSTWLSGFFLLVWVYYAQASLYLVDPAVANLPALVAALIGLGGLALGWLIYDRLCRSFLSKHEVVLAGTGFAFIILMAFLFQHAFSGRGALLHTGAMMASMMVGNVFFVIMPNQRKIIAELVAGRTPDPAWGKQGKIRSTHNNYLTLPVLFLMLAPHAPLTFSTPYAFVIVGLILVAGALIRHFYNTRHAGGGDQWWTWLVAVLCIWSALWISSASSPIGRERLGLGDLPTRIVAADLPKAPVEVSTIIEGRCAMCHGAVPSYEGIGIAPHGVLLDTPESIARNKPLIRIQAVITHAMPPNNVSEITPEERHILAQWTGDASAGPLKTVN